MDLVNLPITGVEVKKRKKKKASQISNEHCGVELTSEENKILNTSKTAFIATSHQFEEVLNELIIDGEVYEKLLQLQDVIQAKLLTFKYSNEDRYESEYDRLSINNLNSSKSLASSTLSLSSQKSVSVQSLVGNNAYKKFLNNINCPFCFKAQQDKINLIKHLDENCQPLKDNVFEERNFIPFSAFQILPNNTIKCNLCHNSVTKNLKHFFIHLHNQKHKSEYSKAAKVKKYTDFVYCSCCKILIPNNYTQLDFHMNHKTHKRRSALAPQNLEFLNNVDCVYLKNKKFKCLICPSRFVFQSAKDILGHFEKEYHGNKLKNGMFPNAFCEVCMTNVHIFEILSHLNSHDHIQKEKSTASQELYETCYYCGFVCSSLKELSVHMITQCKEVSSMREQNLTAEKLHKNDIKNESKEQKCENSMSKNNMPTKGIGIKRENTKEGQHIIVKDNTDVLEVYKYFKKFGEITRVEMYKEKNVLIHYRDKSAVEDALLLRDVIHINGVKVEITDEALTESASAVKTLEKEIDSDEEHLLETSDESHSDDNELGPAVPNTKLENLFRRVSQHLSNTTKVFDSNLEEKILEDCAEILGQNRNHCVVGFAGLRLSFPNERMDLYCEVKECCAKLTGKFYFPENLGKIFFSKLSDTSKWRDVNTHFHSNFPYIECTHVTTRKSCRLIFTPSAKLLTDMLSYCIEKLDVAKNFCMIVRFWFAVHKLKIGQLDFAVISLLIFFLVKTYIISNVRETFSTPVTFSFAKLTEHTELKQLRRGMDNKLPSKMSNVVALFQEFLAFLCKFDFRKKMIILPLDFGVPRKVIDYKGVDGFFLSFDLNELRECAMCVMDPLLRINLTKDVSQDDLESLLQAAQNTLRNTA